MPNGSLAGWGMRRKKASSQSVSTLKYNLWLSQDALRHLQFGKKLTLSRRKRTSCNSIVFTVDMTAHLAVCRREERSERGREERSKKKRGRKGGRKTGRKKERDRERGEGGEGEICYKHVKIGS